MVNWEKTHIKDFFFFYIRCFKKTIKNIVNARFLKLPMYTWLVFHFIYIALLSILQLPRAV